MYVIGTAGHVDHGKSTLVEALTGIHPDRLREERERGLTIELGFAWTALPSGREVSIVDVPGHVRFVRHMLAGIGAVDLVLLVIAADEGVMPQTREHLEILDLLGVERGLIVLAKCDLVDAEWAELVDEEVRGALAGSSLADAPLVRVSAANGEGLDALRAAIDAALDGCAPPRDVGRPRLGVDRVFTMPGFGTVVTGTLLDGVLHVGDTLQAVPAGPSARVRGLQTHRRGVDEAQPGTRVAVNLAGVAVDDLRRGQVLATPGRLPEVHGIDAALRALPERPLRHNLRVTLHSGVSEVQGRLRVLGAEEVPAGGEGWGQVLLAEPMAALAGDRFVLRVSDQTLGGGTIVEVNPARHRRSDPALLERLAARASGSTRSQVLAALERLEPATVEALVEAVEADAGETRDALEALVAEGEVLAVEPASNATLHLSRTGRDRLARSAAAALAAYHREHPLRWAMPAEELRSRLALTSEQFAALLPLLAPEVEARPYGVHASGWEPRTTQAQRQEAERIVSTLEAAGAQPPRLDIDPELVRYLVGAGRVVDCGDGVLLSTVAFAEARDRVLASLHEAATLRLAEARDALGTNRRVAQAVLERLDALGLTTRRGDERVLGPAAAQLAATEVSR